MVPEAELHGRLLHPDRLHEACLSLFELLQPGMLLNDAGGLGTVLGELGLERLHLALQRLLRLAQTPLASIRSVALIGRERLTEIAFQLGILTGDAFQLAGQRFDLADQVRDMIGRDLLQRRHKQLAALSVGSDRLTRQPAEQVGALDAQLAGQAVDRTHGRLIELDVDLGHVKPVPRLW
ncbi:MAG: hypothetical protein EON55_08835 [Alphaproteobacteria bacterium]|nr:MAG: hypothetical protein EON55_08835 [Alphaproteobacteria bacterium]